MLSDLCRGEARDHSRLVVHTISIFRMAVSDWRSDGAVTLDKSSEILFDLCERGRERKTKLRVVLGNGR